MAKPKIICWDLDETLGFFRDMHSVRNKEARPDPDDSYLFRTDIIKTLNHLISKDYRHVVTSSAKKFYTEGVINAVCLDAYFDYIFGRGEVTDGGVWGKLYIPVATLYELDEAEARANMLVIANQASDEPIDVDIVFLHDERPLEESARIYEVIAEELWDMGDEDFHRGFQRLFDMGRRVSSLDQDFNFTLSSAVIGDSIAFDMGYKNSPCTEGLKVPIIMNIRRS